jgi:uncharacterized protein
MTAVWIVCAIIVLIIVGVAAYSATEITKIPFLAIPYTPKDYDLPSEDLAFQSADGLKLTGWFIPARQTSDVTVMVLHGLGSNTGDMLQNCLSLAKERKWNLFFFNFRGHGTSEGDRTSLGPLELSDFESALRFIRQAKPNATRRIGLFGHSLGAAVAIVGAARHPEIGAVLAESPFARTRKTIAHFGRIFYGIPPFPFMYLALLFARFRLGVSLWGFSPLDEIKKIAPRPFLMIHAERDLRMPTVDMEALMKAAGEPKTLWVVPGADHGEPWMVAKAEYDQRLVDFYRRAFP